ncbi:Neural-cadherin Cadherin-N [Channa argus]|uniref:Neural-cadherin Cadherin-N n=1 Tax=Channa argus TaxID=215402 RepID=A0A6G1PGC5_CHAAH|nr:Neural-cadherin Cadherin-N [Channa argus]
MHKKWGNKDKKKVVMRANVLRVPYTQERYNEKCYRTAAPVKCHCVSRNGSLQLPVKRGGGVHRGAPSPCAATPPRLALYGRSGAERWVRIQPAACSAVVCPHADVLRGPPMMKKLKVQRHLLEGSYGERLPFFHGHIFENSPTASKVNGLSIPVRRINAQKWCPVPGMHFQLYGNGSEDFRAFAYHKRGNILLKTSRVLDREARSEYMLSLGLCCQTCVSESVVFEVASIKVDVLDANDHEPTFRSADTLHITLDDTTALRSVVYKIDAVDADSGKNAELTYISVPKNSSFYVVPKTGEVLLVDSILGLPSEVKFCVFARDHGWPPLTSKGVVVTISPHRWATRPADLSGSGRAGRSPRALLDPGTVVSLNVSEDASIGSVIASLSPARFQSASYELIYPESESSPISVARDSGDITITRRLDRETEPFVELSVKIQDKRGIYCFVVIVPYFNRLLHMVKLCCHLDTSHFISGAPEQACHFHHIHIELPVYMQHWLIPQMELREPEEMLESNSSAHEEELFKSYRIHYYQRYERLGQAVMLGHGHRMWLYEQELRQRLYNTNMSLFNTCSSPNRPLCQDWYLNKVKLKITDVNDNIPEWNMKPYPYLAVVSPEASAGTFVYQLQAYDRDEGKSGEVEYFLSDGGDGCFAVEKKTGQVVTTGLVLQRDREYLLSVVALDGLGSRSAPAMLSVVAGARAPQFTNASYAISIPENTPEGQPFLGVFAISFQRQPVSYSLLINPSSLFVIRQETGEISLTRTLDYESDQRRYLLMVRASEEPSSLSTATEVQVLITDENDCVPEFLQSIYSVDGVPETVTTATSLLQVLATDCDSGLNAELTYYTLSADFSISPHGTVFPAARLDYEKPNHLYEFVVMAVDGGDEPHSGTATVRVRMANINDEAPEFSQPVYRTFVSEDAGPNTLVATVLAKDPDGDGIIYSIAAGNEEGNFVIDSQKGLIRLRSTPLPKLQGLEYILNVTATDDNASGGPQPLSSTARVIVGVDDVNNNKPVFEECQQYREQASVLENQPTGTFVLQVHAVDADEGANGKVKYGLMHRDSVMPAFKIHPDTGVIVTARRFDRERQREYSVTVTATDWAEEPLIGICQLTVQILDQNDNSPKFENLRYEYFLREDTLVGTSFLRVAAHDDDFGTNAAITYSMSLEQPEYLRVNPVTGWVYVNQPISQRTYITWDIIATDGGNRSTSVELAVTITNVKNQPPQWEKESYSVVIPENTARDTPIVTIKATSHLGDPRVTYNLEDGMVPETNMPVRFYLSPNREDGSASILVSEPLDYETTPFFSLRVRAQNVAAVPLAAFTTVYVNITDVNDNVPFFTSSIYEALVTEGAQIGTMVLQVSAHDKDLGLNGQITYSLLSDSSGDHRLFRIDPELGIIYTEAVFDREARSSHLLEVQSEDGQESARPGRNKQANTDTAYVRVFISDVNDNKPVFAQRLYEVGVDENADVGLAVVTVSANDEDEGANAKLRYQITSGNKGGVFDIEPEVGTIFIAQPLDYEQQKRYKLLVLASDGKWEDYAAVVVTVVNKNDEAPVFSMNEYYASVTEELDGSPVFVLQVTANDPDKDADQGAIRYSIHGQGAESHFMINDITGEMYAQRTLDREERAVWRFVVMATDEEGEGLTGFTDVIINVWDINDNAPTFSCAPDNCHSSVAENSTPGTFVVEMTALDLDDAAVGQNAILTYRITENAHNANNVELFSIDSTTGTISVAADGLDREFADSHLLVVEARDGGGMTGTATATILVTDINDHIPKFKMDWCGAHVPETTKEDASILELNAVDPDAGTYGQLTFSVVAGDPEQQFYIVSRRLDQTGTLRLKQKLDFEKPGQQRFNLTIKVEDSDYSSLIHCLVLVEDENDNAPVFAPSSNLLLPLPEDTTVGTSIIQVVATDSDSGLNGDILYSILPQSDPYGHFTVSQAGMVTVASPLDRETVAGYELVVMATDQGNPALTGSVTVHLTLLDMNDNGPELEIDYTPVLWENSPAPQVVWLNRSSTLLHVVDRDSPEHGPPFSLSLPSLYSIDFHLQDHGNGSATLTALRRFDRERQSEFHLPVIMTDSGNPPMTATNTLTITIGDQNDNAHQGGEKDVYVHSHKGRMANAALGKVYAPDPDDWDNKSYTLETSAAKYFSLNQSSGVLTIRQNTPAGSYWLRVSVSDGVWPDVMSGVRVHVKELEEKAILSSASLRLTGITAKDFIDSYVEGKSRLEMFWDFLSETLSVRPGSVNIFSIADVEDKTVDIHFYVLTDNGYLRPEKLHGVLAAYKKKLQSLLRVNVSQVQVDECVRTHCKTSGGCSTQLSIGDTPTLLDSGVLSLVSVKVATFAVCGCAAREMTHQPCSSYTSNPCLNGGTCVDSQNGYRINTDGEKQPLTASVHTAFLRHCMKIDGFDIISKASLSHMPAVEGQDEINWCHCPPQLEGPNCQQTRLSFLGNGYAWFPPIRPCFDSHLSLEFMTEEDDGLLLYAGPLATLMPGDAEDYIAIELIGGTPSLKINHGSGTLVLQLTNNIGVADRRWHRLDVKSNSKEVRFTLDRCSSAIVMETEGVDSWAMTEDRSSCEIWGVTPNRDNSMTLVPQLNPPTQCQAVLLLMTNVPTQSNFPPVEKGVAVMASGVPSVACVNLGLPGHTVIKTRVQLGVRTRAAASVILSLLSLDQNEYLRLEVIQGLLSALFNLGDGDYNITLPYHRLDDGEWHEVELDRYGREFTLRLDGGGGRREVTASPGQSQEIIIDPSGVILGNSFPSRLNWSFLGAWLLMYFGCLRDVRFNGRSVPLDLEQPSEGLQVVTSQGVTFGCSSEACRKHNCSPPLVCVDLWRHHECSEGYRGRHCEVALAMFHNEDSNSLSLSSMFAISICVMAFLVLMLGLFLYSCWRRHKGLKEGVYHVSAHHGEWEDIRENVLNYDEEGGGEQDQNAFNMVELQRSLQPSPAQSLRYSYPQSIISYPQTKLPQDNNKKAVSNGNGSAAIALRLAIPPSEAEMLPSPLTFRRSQKTLSFSSQDLARYLCEVIRDMEHPGELGTMTMPRRPSGKERGLTAVHSLSSLSASQGSEVRLQGAQSTRLDRFKTLRAVVSDLRGDSKAPEDKRDKLKESRGQLNCEKSG